MASGEPGGVASVGQGGPPVGRVGVPPAPAFEVRHCPAAAFAARLPIPEATGGTPIGTSQVGHLSYDR